MLRHSLAPPRGPPQPPAAPRGPSGPPGGPCRRPPPSLPFLLGQLRDSLCPAGTGASPARPPACLRAAGPARPSAPPGPPPAPAAPAFRCPPVPPRLFSLLSRPQAAPRRDPHAAGIAHVQAFSVLVSVSPPEPSPAILILLILPAGSGGVSPLPSRAGAVPASSLGVPGEDSPSSAGAEGSPVPFRLLQTLCWLLGSLFSITGRKRQGIRDRAPGESSLSPRSWLSTCEWDRVTKAVGRAGRTSSGGNCR